MASDIVPVQLSLTEGDLVTLWAPRWREDGEEWEAFLGDDDNLFAFPDVTQLAAFVRTAPEHDLIDHPSWSVVPDLTVAELTPDETQRYDVIGVPELAAEDPDTWTVGELAEITSMVRSIADVCELDVVTEVLDSSPAFALLHQGTLPFVGREGNRLWSQLLETIAQRWDDVIDALDGIVTSPAVDETALATAAREVLLGEKAAEESGVETGEGEDDQDDEPDGPSGFWEQVGIDPIRISTRDGELVTLRCYLDDNPVFLGSDGRIEAFATERALARWIGEDGAGGHDLAVASTWREIVERAAVGELDVVVDELNAYDLTGLDHDLAEGPGGVDASQLELAVELLTDVADWAEDTSVRDALANSQSLGWLVSFVIRPDPTRLQPSPPFTEDAAKFRGLMEAMAERLRLH